MRLDLLEGVRTLQWSGHHSSHASSITDTLNDLQQVAPMLAAIRTTLAATGIGDPVQRLAADSGYWSIANVSAIPDAPELLIPPARHGRHGKPRAGTASHRSPEATACGRRCMPSSPASRARSATPSAAGPSSRFRPGQDRPGRWAVHAPGAAGLPGRVEAAVRHHNLLKLWRATTATTS